LVAIHRDSVSFSEDLKQKFLHVADGDVFELEVDLAGRFFGADVCRSVFGEDFIDA
jgi:hypothetical protein